MNKSSFLKVSILISLFLTAPAFASVIYNNSSIFNATLETRVVDDYENSAYNFIQSNAQMTSVLSETSYSTTGWNNLNIVSDFGDGNHYYCAGCNGSFLLDFTSTSVSGANGVFGIGFNYFNYGTPSFNALVTYGNGATEDIALSAGSFFFWGITSELEIKSIHFGLINGGATQQGGFSIDNLTIGNARSVPEPSALLLMGLGLIGLSVSRRKTIA